MVLDPHDAGGTDLLVCRLSTAAGQLTANIPDANYTAPGPVVSHG